MSGLSLIDGVPTELVSAQDRGLMYGDGVFRTLRLAAGRPVWWADQLARLAADCARLGIPAPSRSDWESDLARLGAVGDGVLRLTVTRGIGPRGYRPPVPARPTRIMSLGGLPEWPDGIAQRGATVRVCDLRLGAQPRLAGVKHLNRLENVLARAEWDAPDIHEGLLLDAEGRVVSGVMSNVFIYRDGQLLTPSLDRCGVAGAARARLLARAPECGLAVHEAELTLDDVLGAEEVFLTNSLIRAWRVQRLGERVWPEAVAYALVRKCLDD